MAKPAYEGAPGQIVYEDGSFWVWTPSGWEEAIRPPTFTGQGEERFFRERSPVRGRASQDADRWIDRALEDRGEDPDGVK